MLWIFYGVGTLASSDDWPQIFLWFSAAWFTAGNIALLVIRWRDARAAIGRIRWLVVRARRGVSRRPRFFLAALLSRLVSSATARVAVTLIIFSLILTTSLSFSAEGLPASVSNFLFGAGTLAATLILQRVVMRAGIGLDPSDLPIKHQDLEESIISLVHVVNNRDRVVGESDARISLITPFRNSEATLQACIRSVTDQTSDKWELVLVDDGSQDRSAQIAKRAQSEYPGQVLLLDSHSPGAGAARNAGIRVSTSPLIGFLDSDDLLLPRYVEHVLLRHRESLFDAAIFGFLETSVGSKIISEATWNSSHFDTRSGQLLRWGELATPFTSTSPMIWNKVFGRELIEKSGVLFPSSGEMIEDLPTTYSWLLHSDSCWVDLEPVYLHQESETGLFARHFSEFRYLLEALKELKERTAALLNQEQRGDFARFVRQQTRFFIAASPADSAASVGDDLDPMLEHLGLTDNSRLRLIQDFQKRFPADASRASSASGMEPL